MLVAQIALDYFAIVSVFYFSYWLWIHSNSLRINSDPQHLDLKSYFIIGLIFIVIFKIAGAYSHELSITQTQERHSILKGIIWSYSFLIISTFFYPKIYLSRLQSVYSIILLLVIITSERLLFHFLNKFLLKQGIGTKRVLVYGAGETGKRLVKKISAAPKLGYHVVGYIDDRKYRCSENCTTELETPILGRLEHVKDLTRQFNVDEMMIAMPSASSKRISEIINKCNGALPNYQFVPSVGDLHLQQLNLRSINGIPLCTIKKHQPHIVSDFLKRLFDIIFSFLVLFITSPIMAIVALKIKHESPGPVIFSQVRIGKNNKPFTMLKFRTMYADSEAYATTPKDRTDPRITPFGRFLRQTSLDELPQFINVLLGHMSVVGPRPEMGFIVKDYNEIQRQRLAVRPGITGLWQISLDRSKPIHEAIEHDLYYIENQAIFLDLLIIWETLIFCLLGVIKNLKV